jgi:hypothetical protein
MADLSEGFGLFLSSIQGQPVARFGSTVMIGAERDLIDRKAIRYMPELVVAIPTAEARRYAREYRRAIDNGSVTVRTADDWIAQQAPPEPTPAEPAEPEPAEQLPGFHMSRPSRSASTLPPSPSDFPPSSEAGAPLQSPADTPDDEVAHGHSESSRIERQDSRFISRR